MSTTDVPATDIPPTEPQPRPKQPKQPKPAQAKPQAAQAKMPQATRIKGEDLTIDPTKHVGSIEQSYWYWIGSLPGLPIESAHFGGECFPKMEERVGRSPDGSTSRAPVIGALVRLTAAKVRKMAGRISRTVVRWRGLEQEEIEDQKGREATGVGQGVEAVTADQQRRRGYLITIPTAAEVAAKREAGRPANLYQAKAGDEPVSRYLFAALCPDQGRPSRSDHYPEPLEVTGLEWPGQLD